MAYDIKRLLELSVNINKFIDPDDFFEAVINEAMYITNCDGGTIYIPGKEGLTFQYVRTKSKYITMGCDSGATSLPPIPMDKHYACAQVAITQEPLNIRDVYYAKNFDFNGTYVFDKSNSYRSHSMLILPMSSCFELVGVIQLINSIDPETGHWTPFTSEHEQLGKYLAGISAIKLENMKLKGLLADKRKLGK